MSVDDENLAGALRSSGDGLKPAPGWQADVRRTIRNSDMQRSEKRQRPWFGPALLSSLCTAILIAGVVFFLKNQSDDRAEAVAAEEAQALATAAAKKEIRALAAASAQLEADTAANNEAIEKALAEVAAAGAWDEESSDPMVRKIMEEMQAAAKQQERLAKAMASAESESALRKQKYELTEVNKIIAEKALGLLKLKRRMDAHTYHRIDARHAAAKNLKARRAEAGRLAEVRKSQAKSAAKAKRKADKKKFNKCANSSDPLCGL